MDTFFFFFLTGTLGLTYIGYSLKKDPGLLSIRLNRNIIYIGLMFTLALLFGIVGSKLRNNAIFFLASVCTEFCCYFCLSWLKLSIYGTKVPAHHLPLVLKPRVLFYIILTCLFELVCFLFAGNQSLSIISISEAEEDVKNTWLWLASFSTLIFVCCGSVISLFALYNAIKQTTDLKLEYRYTTLGIFIIFFTLYFGFCTVGIVVLTLGLVNHEGYSLIVNFAGVVGAVPAFALMITMTIFDKKGYQAFLKVKHKTYKIFINELKNFSDKTMFLFPSNYRFNPYDFSAFQSSDWLLNSIISQLLDIRMFIWRIQAWLEVETKEINIQEIKRNEPVSIEYEARVWNQFITQKVNQSVIKSFSQKIAPSNAVPPLPTERTEQLARFFIVLNKEIEKISNFETTKEINILERPLNVQK